MKCVVSGCPNRSTANHGAFNRDPKRFFSFPKDTARVKVWLAALRETDKQDATEQHLICEDHFLPEDISASGINKDAIPIMPPYLDGPMGIVSPWGAASASSEEEEEEEEEDDLDEVPWAIRGDEDEGRANVAPAAAQPQQDPCVKTFSETKSFKPCPRKETPDPVPRPEPAPQTSRQDVSLGVLTQGFLELLTASPDCSVDLRHVISSLQTRRRRIYDITNVLEGIRLIERQSANKFRWIGRCALSSSLWMNKQKFQRELENLKLVENTLDILIKSCAQQLFDLTDDEDNAAAAYVTHEDVSRLGVFREQTVIVVKAPEETKLEVPAPKEDSIQVHLKGERGPIRVLTCDVGSAESAAGPSGRFLTLEESRIETAELHTESSTPQSSVQTSVQNAVPTA